MTPRRIDRLKRAGLDNLFLSLDYFDAQKHDAAREITGLYDNVVDTLQYLGGHFIEGHRSAGIMCVVSRKNLDSLDQLVELARRMNVHITFQLHHGRKTGNGDDEVPDVPAVVEALLRLKKKYRGVIASQRYINGMLHYGHGRLPHCRAGEKYFSIDPYGYVHPCVDLPHVGHVLDDGMSAMRSPVGLRHVIECSGCWYCFRGEADVSFSVSGCFEKTMNHVGLILGNLTR